MSTRVRIKMNPGYAGILGRELTVRSVERERAEEAVSIAQSAAPRLTGAYADSITVEQEGDTVKLVASDFKANWIEFGTIHNRAFRTLTNAAEQVSTHVRVE